MRPHSGGEVGPVAQTWPAALKIKFSDGSLERLPWGVSGACDRSATLVSARGAQVTLAPSPGQSLQAVKSPPGAAKLRIGSAPGWLAFPSTPSFLPPALVPPPAGGGCEPGGWLPRSRCDRKDSQGQSAFSMLVLSLEMELIILPARIFCGSEQSQSKRHWGSLEVSVLEPEPPSAPLNSCGTVCEKARVDISSLPLRTEEGQKQCLGVTNSSVPINLSF